MSNVKGTTKPVSRKRSYRPVQYSLVVASFVASLMGGIWLQGQEGGVVASNLAGSAIVAEASANDLAVLSEPILVPTPVPTQTATSVPMESAPAASQSVAVPLVPTPAPTSVPPTAIPVPQEPTPIPQQQVAPTTTLPRAVARSRSSR